MNVRIAREALQMIEGTKDQSSESRVASRWLRASMATDYDLLIRLQILEGVAGVPVDTWWKKPKAEALREARTAFEGMPIKPEWLEAQSSTLFDVLTRKIGGLMRSYKLDNEPYEVIHNSLMGIGLKGEAGIERAPYNSGKKFSEEIKHGRETPLSVAQGPLSFMLSRKVHNMAKGRPSQMAEDDEGAIQEFTQKDLPAQWGASEEETAAKYLTNLFFYDQTDSLGHEIRDLMRQVWSRGGAESRVLVQWLDLIKQGMTSKDTKDPTGRKQDLADYFGILPQAFQKIWIRGWTNFLAALWADSSLMTKINQRLRDRHFETLRQDMPAEVLHKILVPTVRPYMRGTRKPKDQVEHVVTAYLKTH